MGMGKNETSWDRGFQTFNLGGPCCVNLLSELGPLVIGVHDESVSVRLSHVQINLAWGHVGRGKFKRCQLHFLKRFIL